MDFYRLIRLYSTRLFLFKGVKPTNVCNELGIGGSFLPDIKRGRIPSVEKVQMLAAYLGVTTSELLGEEKKSAPVSEGGPVQPPEYEFLNPANKAIADLVKSQPPAAKVKLYIAAEDGARIETEMEVPPDFKLPDSAQALPDEYKVETDCKAPALKKK